MSGNLGRLLSLLSHELRAPLGVVRGYLRLLDGSPGVAEAHRHAVAGALRAGDRMAELAEQITMLAHLERGDVRLDERPVALASLLNAAVQAVKLPENSPATLDVLPVDNFVVSADEPRLRLALASLVGAVARAQTREVAVELSATAARLHRGAAVRVRIGPRTLTSVSASEVDLDLSRGGLGLDLPIAAAVVSAHGGQIRELKHGAAFVGLAVTLPLAR